jgi:phosphate transport system protein
MTRYFQREIRDLKKKILHLAAMVEESLRAAVGSVTDSDSARARRVIEQDNEIDQMEVELEEDCLKILALHQPVAIDLRFLIAALKINNDLERIGDLAVNIAKRTRELSGSLTREVPFDLANMLQLALDMVKKSVDSLVEMDVDLALEVCESDDQMDDYHRSAYTAVEKRIQEEPEKAGYYIRALSISQNLERIADHATNIAEDVIYMVDGEIVRHKVSSLK